MKIRTMVITEMVTIFKTVFIIITNVLCSSWTVGISI